MVGSKKSKIQDEISKILVPFNDMLEETSSRTRIYTKYTTKSCIFSKLITKVNAIMKKLSYLPVFLSVSDHLL